MDKVYLDTPHNFSEIEPFIITDKTVIEREVILAERCYFYDTCAFRNHMTAEDVNLIFQYIKATSGVVIITRTILMELCSNDGCLWQEHVEYIKNMSSKGIQVFVLYEETIFEILHVYCADVSEINKWLSFAVRCAKSKVGTVELVINQDAELKRFLLEGNECKDGKLADKLFQKVRGSKSSGDNLGEELLAICIHWLSHMRDDHEYKYAVFTDDKKAIPTFGKIIKNIKEHLDYNSLLLCTTAKLCYLMYKTALIDNQSQIIGILSSSNSGCDIKVYCSEEFELGPNEKKMSVQDFAGKVLSGKMKVYY